MNIYAIYVNPKQKDNNFIIIKEGFSWMAALFSVFWALYYRMWIPLIIALIFNVVGVTLNIDGLIPISKIATMLIFGFFASDIREYDLERKSYNLKEIILARSKIEAELKLLERL